MDRSKFTNASDDFDVGVLASDVEYAPSDGKGGPIFSPIMGYKESRGEWSSKYFDLPMFQELNWNKPSFWCSSLGEAVLSRAPVLSFHSRGCFS